VVVFQLFFQRQEWQNEAIDNYYEVVSRIPKLSKFNDYGRGYPDISAQSASYIICMGSEYWSVSGTSCSCPSVAGMFALINDIRLQNGKPTLGWILPVLYNLMQQDTKYVNDIVDGTNEGCSDDNNLGFSASVSWDPVTGFGTPKFPYLLEALLEL